MDSKAAPANDVPSDIEKARVDAEAAHQRKKRQNLFILLTTSLTTTFLATQASQDTEQRALGSSRSDLNMSTDP